jgi:endonuclease/exonuclease/phosphatase family metal-dependent hydrolase
MRISLVSYNMMHFQGVSQKIQPLWAEFADKEWYPNPNKPGYYEFFTRVFKSLDADIIAIQESTVTQHDNWGGPEDAHDEMAVVPELARRLGMNYFIQEKSRWHGFSLLSKFPVVDSKDFSHDGTPGTGLIRVTLRLNKDTQLHVYNTHLHYKDAEVRKQELVFNQKVIDKENLHPHVYVGDFNIEPMASSELDILRANQYTGANNGVDYIWVKKGGNAHIAAFASIRNRFTCRNISAGGTVGSDHIPVKAIIQAGSKSLTEQQRKNALLEITNAESPSIKALLNSVKADGKNLFTKDLTDLITPAENNYLAVSIVSVEGQPFKRALRLQTKTPSESSWDINVSADIETSVAKGDVVITRFKARAIQTESDTNSAGLIIKFQQNVYPWTGYMEKAVKLTTEWILYEVPFVLGENYDSGNARVIFFLGYEPQTIEIAGLEVVNYEKFITIEQLQSAATYEEYEGITLKQY